MRRLALLIPIVVSALLPTASVHALDNVDPYICPTALHGSGIDCFFEAVSQTYTMCRQVKSIEIIEFGLAGAQEGVHGAKTEGCIEKHKRLMARPYQAALREAGRDNAKVQHLHELYATWTKSMVDLTPGPDEIDAGYKQRVTHPYGTFERLIKAMRESQPEVAAPKPATKKKSAAQ